MRDIRFPAVFSLSTLDGQNGVKMYDEKNTNYNNGFSVKTAGDINNDGYDDIVIGTIDSTYTISRSYVIFGQPKIGINGFLSLSDLNGENGFKIEGENSGGSSLGNTAGDINLDSYDDLIIGTRDYSYVIFGHPKVGIGGLIALSNLNGTNGFKIKAEIGVGYTEPWVGSAGDVNGDGYPDVLISASSGSQPARSYVVFGGSDIGKTGQILLSDLNGTNGFKIDTEMSTATATVASGVSDINGDGFSDFIIGNAGYNNSRGRCYVIFGGMSVGSSGLIALANLNGSDGFKLTAEVDDSDSFGNSVAGINDVNGDSYPDLLIGAPGYGNGQGRSYVIFGTKNIGSSGIMSVSNLNGSNGFKLSGEFNGYGSNTIICCSGMSVSGAGDINGDGYADFQIGAKTYNSDSREPGGSYVIFGGSKVGNSGLVSLSKLDGVIGFKISGEISNSQGMSVSAAGDINGDGYPDLLLGDIGNSFSSPIDGRSYAVTNFNSETSEKNINLILGISITAVLVFLLGCYCGVKKYIENRNKADSEDFMHDEEYVPLFESDLTKNFRGPADSDLKPERKKKISENLDVSKSVIEYHSFDEKKYSPALPMIQPINNPQETASLKKTVLMDSIEYVESEGVAEDQKEVATQFRQAAEQGQPEAQFNLGVCYAKGEGVMKDQKEAIFWFRKAAEQGHPEAQFNLGRCYFAGEGVTKDQKEGVGWIHKAANQDLSQAQYLLGICYFTGEGVVEDQKEAALWFRKAAKQGHASAQYGLGRLYYEGAGVLKDQQEAVAWYRKAAEQNFPDAQFDLSRCLAQGVGVTKDLSESLRWMRKAAGQGHVQAAQIISSSSFLSSRNSSNEILHPEPSFHKTY